VDLSALGVEVTNCSPDTDLPWFPRAPIEGVLG
jgi:hypothetical protein